MKPLDFNKPIQTRDGRKVEILATKLLGHYPVAGNIEGEVSFQTWTASGKFSSFAKEHGSDLINVPEPKKWRAWKAEEVPLGAWVQDNWSSLRFPALILKRTATGPLVAGYEDAIIFHTLLSNFEHSTDGGKTFQPCGVLE